MKLTRDSLVLILGFIAALIGFLMLNDNPPMLWTYKQWLQSGLFVVGWWLGKLGTSPLPGKNDDQTVSGAGGKLLGLLLVCALAGASLISCGPKMPAQLPAVAATVTMTETQLRDQVDKCAKVLDVALDNIRDINAAEKVAEPQMNDATKKEARALMTAAVDGIQKGAKALKASVHSYEELKKIVDPVLAQLGDLQKFVTGLTAGQKAAGGFGALVEGLARVAFSMLNLGAFGGEPVLAGGL